jgi:ABC-type branched-subunit amino acid transport system ATPase component
MLAVRGLISGYAGVPVLHGLDLEVHAGEAVAVVGANGAGKSTLVRALCGLSPAMAGRIELDGQDIAQVSAHERAAHGIAVVLEGRHLFGELSVQDNLRLAWRSGRQQAQAQAQAGATFDLEAVYELFPVVRERRHSTVSLLSGGQQQMVAIARALLLQPRVLVMDELTTGLAPLVVQEILSVLARLRQRGLALLIVEQSIAIAAEQADRTYVMSVGRIVREISRDEWPTLRNDERLVQAYLQG